MTSKTIAEIILFLAVFLALTSPGIFLVSAIYSRKSLDEKITFGVVTGLAINVYLIFIGSYCHFNAFYVLWGLMLIGSLGLHINCRKRTGGNIEPKPVPLRYYLLLIIVATAISRFYITTFSILPAGWDPSFHLILSAKYLELRTQFDNWEPFAPATQLYPVGSHYLVSHLSYITNRPPHIAYKFLMATLGVLTTLQVYVFSRRVTGKAGIAILAAFSYSFLALYGSIDYHKWGGLPNQLGMCFLIAAITVITESLLKLKETIIFALFTTTLMITHHHVMITAQVVNAALIAYYLLLKIDKQRVRTIAGGLAISGIVGAPFWLPYVIQLLSVNKTEILKFEELLFGPSEIMASLGYAFSFLAVAGITVYFLKKRRFRHGGLLVCLVTTLMLCFIFWGYIYRFLSLIHYGKGYVGFTPSRFLTDLVIFISVFAGFALYRFQKKLRISNRTLMIALPLLSLTNLPQWKQLYVSKDARIREERLLKAFTFIREETPAASIVLIKHQWASYCCWRRTMYSSIPIGSMPHYGNYEYRDEVRRILLEPDYRPKEEIYLVAVGRPESFKQFQRILWQDPSGVAVLEIYSR